MPLRTRCGTSRLPCMSLGVRAQGLGPRGGGTALAITICSVLPSVPYDAVGPPKFILLSRLNIQPARLPVNASPLLSRTTTHDSGPIWFATPSLGGTCTRETYRFVPAHREVKILMRLPDCRNVAAVLREKSIRLDSGSSSARACRRRCRRFEFPVRAGKTPSRNGMPRSLDEDLDPGPGQRWTYRRPGPQLDEGERASPLRCGWPGLDSGPLV